MKGFGLYSEGKRKLSKALKQETCMIRTKFSRENSKISVGDGSNREETRIRAELKQISQITVFTFSSVTRGTQSYLTNKTALFPSMVSLHDYLGENNFTLN